MKANNIFNAIYIINVTASFCSSLKKVRQNFHGKSHFKKIFFWTLSFSKLLLKPSCHIPFTYAYSALHCVFLILILIEPTNVITRKTQRNAENAWINGMCKRTLKTSCHIRFTNAFSALRCISWVLMLVDWCSCKPA